MDERPVIGITLGDPNGVGPEIIVKILSQEWVYELCRPLVIGHDGVLRKAFTMALMAEDDSQGGRDGRETAPNLDIQVTSQPAAGLYRHGTVDVLNAADVETDGLKPGQEQAEAGRLAVESVKRAARLAMAGDIAALVTAPMNKAAMSQAGYAYAGHTELLAEITGTKRFRLALAFDGILVSHATTHVSLRDAIDRLSEEEILITVDLVGNALAGMGVAAPRIAVCGLNPHAGEGGLFGDEEIRIIAPAIEKAREKVGARCWRITGPLPPDTVFMRARKGDFDGIIGMYHDQGHIPVKAIAFDRTVNVTLGLPIIRTSVDHGTAFDIAGKGIADAGNLGEALRMAVSLVGEQWSKGDGQGAQTTS
ncbi:MAG: 4-hydroxythreonine-4-phosphate dehydrogenase PdxA [Gemmatimonadetes bacterium]|nr:4-hydroxythreonine-4-phosphate dehydrogenase PdxA [Gemmatimonadota bacterium]